MLSSMMAGAEVSAPTWRWGQVVDGTTAAGDNCIANTVTTDGSCLWLGSYATTFGSTDIKFGSSLLFSTEGTAAADVTAANLCLLKTDQNGGLSWQLHTLGADCASANGGVAGTSDGGCVFAATLRHADVSAMPVIKVIDGAGTEYSLPWEPTQRSYSILAGKTNAAGAIQWMRLYHVDTTPGPAAAGNTADFWSNCINLGNIAVDSQDNIYMIMNLRNTLAVAAADGATVNVEVHNNADWTGDSQKASGDFVLLSLDNQGYYRNHLNIEGSCQVAYGQRVAVNADRVYAQGYITGNGNTLTVGDNTLAPSTVMSPTLICTDTNLDVAWAKCFAGATVGGKYGFQYTNLNVVANTLWMTGMFNLAFGDGTNSVSSTQGTVREGLILKLDAGNGSWLGACTSRDGNFNQPSAVANTGLTGYMGLIQPDPDKSRIYVFGYVMNAAVGVFLREYDAETLKPNLADGQYNIITGGGVPTAICSAFDSGNGALFVAARGNKAFAPFGGTPSAAPSNWAVYMSRFDLPQDTATSLSPSILNNDYNADAPVEYYNLQGVKIQTPTQGLCIRRQGSKVEKVFIK